MKYPMQPPEGYVPPITQPVEGDIPIEQHSLTGGFVENDGDTSYGNTPALPDPYAPQPGPRKPGTTNSFLQLSPLSRWGGSEQLSSTKYLTPDARAINKMYQGFQPSIRDNQLQRDAREEQQGLRGRMGELLGHFGEGTRMGINEQYRDAANNAAGGMQNRGFAGSSLNINAQLGVERGRQGALGQLDDQLMDKRLATDSSITGKVTENLFGSANQMTDLFGGALSAGGMGRFAKGHTKDKNQAGIWD